MIDGLGNKPSQAIALSAIIDELEKSGYEVVTVSNAGSTYSGVQLLEIIDSTGNSVENITLQQTDSTTLKVNLSMTEGTSKVYVNISGLYYELSLNDTKIELSENGQSNVTGERYTLKLVPTTTKATMKIGQTSITNEQTILDGTEITVTALSTIGEENFTIKVENEDGTTKDTKTGNVTIVQKPIHPTSMTISATGNKTQIDVEEELQLSTTTVPTTITDTITWSSSDTNKATVDNTGLVTGVAEGTATITATAKDSNNNVQKTATYQIIVLAPSTVALAKDTLKAGDYVNVPNTNKTKKIKCIVYQVTASRVKCLTVEPINSQFTLSSNNVNKSNIVTSVGSLLSDEMTSKSPFGSNGITTGTTGITTTTFSNIVNSGISSNLLGSFWIMDGNSKSSSGYGYNYFVSYANGSQTVSEVLCYQEGPTYTWTGRSHPIKTTAELYRK